MRYAIFPALHEESNCGWVWLALPNFKPRSIVIVKNRATSRAVYCESRTLDENFRLLYNERPHTRKISEGLHENPIVISDWYREALQIDKELGGGVDLTVEEAKALGWRCVRSTCHHPDPVVRLASRLGMFGLALSVFGATAGLVQGSAVRLLAGIVIAHLLVAVCWPIKR
jgi:hypothetical protein